MNISSKGLKLIEEFEGLRLTAYKCVPTEKYWTIGYGHYGADVTAGMSITQEQAEEYLRKDVATAENAVNAIGKPFNQNQFDALVSFTYNCGAGNLRTLCKDRDIATIGEKLALYNKSGGKVLAGLVRRRKEEQELYNAPVSGQASDCGYTVGKTYTLQSEMKVRTGAGTNYRAKTYKELTAGGKKADADKDGALDKGTKVTCQEVKIVGKDTWIRIPSGWVAAIYKGKVYVK